MTDKPPERAQEQQPALLDSLAPAPPPAMPAGAAAESPVAQVLLETAVPHLDRPFDYAVPEEMHQAVQPGCRVKVRFSGRELAGIVVSRAQQSSTPARLSLISKVISPLPVVSQEILQLAEQVAQRYAGVTADVLRAAVPARAARVEKEFAELNPPPARRVEQPGPRRTQLALRGYGDSSAAEIIRGAVKQCLHHGGDAVVVVPNQRDVDQVAAALEEQLPAETVARLSAEMGPTPRYRSYLRLRYGHARVAVGTRSAVFAPVPAPHLIVMLDDDDPSLAEPRAPYHHAREVALLRAVQTGAGILFVSTSRSLEVQRLVERGWLTDETPAPRQRRAAAPLVRATADSYTQERDPTAHRARMPHTAYRAAREALEHGPVLVQVGRTGFVPAVVCEACRAKQRCPDCHGPLMLPPHYTQSHALQCRWCGLHHRRHRCPECSATSFRAAARGADRTAQELGRAFPNTPVISSTGDQPVASVGAAPALVVSTPGVEPIPAEGYAAALLLDGDAQLAREGLDVPRRVLARWFRAASLVRPHSEDPARSGTVVVTAENEELTGALVRWDPVGYARTELYRRLELGLPPASRMLSITGSRADAEELIGRVQLPEGLRWVGPAPAEEGTHRWLLFFSYAQAADVLAEIRRARRTASAAPNPGERGLRIAVDDVASLQF
ncbi:primosomal protein N' [Nesterenkonia sp.]|uniref:primosomal protein N' family DNA-binding protein n=1 Tax=Nesterenkonia sp. TaxID=704201 RepID=UPI002604413A|nr:primosomal protein N' [Nesterenkonia sp.]